MSKADMRVLIVDDNVEFRSSLGKILRKAGYQVTLAANCFQASRIMSKQDYPLILLDIHLQGKNGLQLLREIKRRSPGSHVIILTVNTGEPTRSEAMDAGAFAFLNKPVKSKKILEYASMALNHYVN